MKKLTFILLSLCLVGLSGCNKAKIAELETQVFSKEEQIKQLEKQVEDLQFTNSSLLDRMSDLSIISKEGAESINKQMESMNQQYEQIQELNERIQYKDSLNLALVMNLKRSLANVNDEDVQVEVRGGVVHISISDKLLFKSGSFKVTNEAQGVLEKVASVINDHNELNVMVEGHTDNEPYAMVNLDDNWDLSVKRATSVVRLLTEEYYVAPERLIAAGRSSYLPREENTSKDGRAKNRRTEIIIMPRLDQFFELMEGPGLDR